MTENEVIIGITKTTGIIFNEEFPNLKKLEIEPYSISYSKTLPLSLKLLLDAPRILGVIRKERAQLQQYIDQYKIDIVISDNRFGLYNKYVECVYITHQLNIDAGWLSGIANKIHYSYIKCFNTIWVPDFEKDKESLAGTLSRNKALDNVKYLGPLSRLKPNYQSIERLDYLCLLSGPEPQRTILEKQLIEIARSSDKRICLIRGTVDDLPVEHHEHIAILKTLSSEQLSMLISNSKTIICRSGYSTLMDLHHLQNTNCILVPTPGQSEQLYLANYWKEKFGAKVLLQKDLDSFSFT